MRRIKELDSIRGLAALSIVFFHLWFQAFSILGTPVDLFFVLSGYLITTIILTNSLNDHFLLSFYARQAHADLAHLLSHPPGPRFYLPVLASVRKSP